MASKGDNLAPMILELFRHALHFVSSLREQAGYRNSAAVPLRGIGKGIPERSRAPLRGEVRVGIMAGRWMGGADTIRCWNTSAGTAGLFSRIVPIRRTSVCPVFIE